MTGTDLSGHFKDGNTRHAPMTAWSGEDLWPDQHLYVDGIEVGAARQEASIPMLFSGDETLDLGGDNGTSASDDYTPETSRFTGTVNWVQLDQGADDHSHLLTPEERLRVAMVRQ